MRYRKSYTEYLLSFVSRHNKSDWKVITSTMDKDGQYVKTYVFEDGAQLTEINRPVWERAEAQVEVKGVKVNLSEMVKLYEIEAWNTDDPTSYKWYTS